MPDDFLATTWPLWFALAVFALAWVVWLVTPDDEDDE
jgi:hypothetical protein